MPRTHEAHSEADRHSQDQQGKEREKTDDADLTGVISPLPSRTFDVVKQPEEQEQTHQDEGKNPDPRKGTQHFRSSVDSPLPHLVAEHRRTRIQQDGPVKKVQPPRQNSPMPDFTLRANARIAISALRWRSCNCRRPGEGNAHHDEGLDKVKRPRQGDSDGPTYNPSP